MLLLLRGCLGPPSGLIVQLLLGWNRWSRPKKQGSLSLSVFLSLSVSLSVTDRERESVTRISTKKIVHSQQWRLASSIDKKWFCSSIINKIILINFTWRWYIGKYHCCYLNKDFNSSQEGSKAVPSAFSLRSQPLKLLQACWILYYYLMMMESLMS